jgi:hypothetical protein
MRPQTDPTTIVSMKYRVSGFTKSSEVFFPISDARFKEIDTARTFCLTAWDVEEKLSLLLDNFYEFEVELLKLAEELVIWSNHEFIDTMQRRLSLDRRLVNLLTAGRLYLDQTDHVISGLFGNPSNELAAIKLFKNKQHDTCWGYRLMEALRNHVQHAGLIVHSISHNYKNYWRRAEGENVPEIRATEFTVIPQTTVEILAQNPEFKKPVLDELKTKGKHVDLRMPTREYVSCMISIHFEIRNLIRNHIAPARKTYESALAEFGKHEGKEVYLPTLEVVDENGTRVKEMPLVAEFLEAFDSLTKKNNAFDSLPRHFASNQVHE